MRINNFFLAEVFCSKSLIVITILKIQEKLVTQLKLCNPFVLKTLTFRFDRIYRLKYQRSITSGYKDVKIRKLEYEESNQFLLILSLFIDLSSRPGSYSSLGRKDNQVSYSLLYHTPYS